MGKNKLKVIDLFSGAGGTTLGLKRAGFTVIGAIDNDNISIESYKVNHPEVKVVKEDINKIDPDVLMKNWNLKYKELDLLAACPPCKGFSRLRITNKGLKTKDGQNDLVFEFLRFVRKLKPKTIMLENVPGMEKDWRFNYLLIELIRMKYKTKSTILNAADYGIPQRRWRLFLICSMKDGVNFAKSIKQRKTVRDAIGFLYKAGESGDILHDLLVEYKEDIKRIIEMIPKNGGSRNKLEYKYKLKCHIKCKGFNDVYGRMKWDDVSPTITCGCINASKGRFLHPEENRAITLREAALLQGFPINYYFSLEKGKQKVAQLIGNALPPDFIKEQGLQIKRHLLKEYHS